VFVEYARGTGRGPHDLHGRLPLQAAAGPGCGARDAARVAADFARCRRARTGRSTGSSPAITALADRRLHKTAMVFQMLRDLIGTEAFDAGIREFWRAHKFRVASGATCGAPSRPHRSAISAGSSPVAGPRRGAVGAVRRCARGPAGDEWRVTVTLAQGAPPYRLRVRCACARARRGNAHHRSRGERSIASFETAAQPSRCCSIPDLDLFRRLAPDDRRRSCASDGSSGSDARRATGRPPWTSDASSRRSCSTIPRRVRRRAPVPPGRCS